VWRLTTCLSWTENIESSAALSQHIHFYLFQQQIHIFDICRQVLFFQNKLTDTSLMVSGILISILSVIVLFIEMIGTFMNY
jgi:hypothetical protein